MTLTRHELQRLTRADRPEAGAPPIIDLRLVIFHDLDELIAIAVRTAAHPSAGNTGPIPIFPDNSYFYSQHTRSAPVRPALPVPSRRGHERR